MKSEFEHINNEVFEICKHDINIAKKFIEQFEEFIEQIEEKQTIEIYGKITNTENLIDEITAMEYLDTENLRKIAYRLELFDRNYTFEIKNAIIDRVAVIDFNNLGDTYTLESIKKEIIEMISDIACDYGVEIDSNERG